ncbi:acetyltransferase [Dermacoccus sp. Ellin185]|uniref:acetyltransferase n=1 Tax=Dermacoccus sp. Ellin185 TaxID=188626 RepID=UPI000586D72F|nr:acetyltransferase [Dermacoccus sp. Ellin185]
MIPLVIIGCGGFGREVWGIAEAINERAPRFEVFGMVDDALSDDNEAALVRLGARHLGGLDWFDDATADVQAVIAIGSPDVRRRIDERLPDRAWATLVHPDTTIGPDVKLAQGCVVAPGARLSTSIRVGRHVHIDQGVTVGHDSLLGDFSRLNPQSCISGNVMIEAGATVGASATVIQGLRVGADALVGAGAVVTRDIEAWTTVKGVPAR